MKFTHFHSGKCILKHHLRSSGNLVSASMCSKSCWMLHLIWQVSERQIYDFSWPSMMGCPCIIMPAVSPVHYQWKYQSPAPSHWYGVIDLAIHWNRCCYYGTKYSNPHVGANVDIYDDIAGLLWGDSTSPKGQWGKAFMFSLICAQTNHSASNRDAGDLKCFHAYYDDTVTMASYEGNPPVTGGFPSQRPVT